MKAFEEINNQKDLIREQIHEMQVNSSGSTFYLINELEEKCEKLFDILYTLQLELEND